LRVAVAPAGKVLLSKDVQDEARVATTTDLLQRGMALHQGGNRQGPRLDDDAKELYLYRQETWIFQIRSQGCIAQALIPEFLFPAVKRVYV
jgi:hypothetical protein